MNDEKQEESISLKELADKTGLAPTTLTSMIDRMEAADLTRRLPDRMTDMFYEGFRNRRFNSVKRCFTESALT